MKARPLPAPRAQKDDTGFTLVEILVALFVFAILASASTAVLTGTLNSKSAVQNQTESIRTLQRARAILKADLAQATIRPARSPFGDQDNRGFVGGLSFEGEPFLRFLRRGFLNPAGLSARSNSQHVSYRIRGRDIIREVFARTDPTRETPITEKVILSDINAVAVEFLVNGVWVPEWEGATYDADRLPSAMALTIDSDAYGRLRQLFIISGARA